VGEEIKVSEEDLLANGSDETRELYFKFKDAILNLADDIQVVANKLYIVFKKGRNIVCMNIQKKQIRMWIGAKWGTIDDAKGIAIDVSNTGHWGTGELGYLKDFQSTLVRLVLVLQLVDVAQR
jgi:predicted transport protein